MSLFIGALAFPDSPALIEEAKIGVVMGSLLSALVGFIILRFAPVRSRDRSDRLRGAALDDVDRERVN